MSTLPSNPISAEYAKIAQGAWIWAVVRGVLAIIFGIVALVAPLTTAAALALVIGIFAIVDGIIGLVDAVRHRGTSGVGFRVFLGIVSLLFGIVILVWPGKTLAFMVILVAIWSIVIGVLQIIASIGIRKESGSVWIWGVISGALGVIFGILVLIWPGVGLVSLIWLIGIWAMVFGIALIVLGLQVRRAGKTAA